MIYAILHIGSALLCAGMCASLFVLADALKETAPDPYGGAALGCVMVSTGSVLIARMIEDCRKKARKTA